LPHISQGICEFPSSCQRARNIDRKVIIRYRPNPITGFSDQKALETRESTDDNQTNQYRNLVGMNPIIRGRLKPDH